MKTRGFCKGFVDGGDKADFFIYVDKRGDRATLYPLKEDVRAAFKHIGIESARGVLFSDSDMLRYKRENLHVFTDVTIRQLLTHNGFTVTFEHSKAEKIYDKVPNVLIGSKRPFHKGLGGRGINWRLEIEVVLKAVKDWRKPWSLKRLMSFGKPKWLKTANA